MIETPSFTGEETEENSHSLSNIMKNDVTNKIIDSFAIAYLLHVWGITVVQDLTGLVAESVERHRISTIYVFFTDNEIGILNWNDS